MFSQVLETAYSGCATTYAEAQQSRAFRRQYEFVSNLLKANPENSALGALLRVGPIRASSLLNQFSFDEAVERARKLPQDVEHDPELLAALGCFGSSLLKASKACLPVKFRKPAGPWDCLKKTPVEVLDMQKVVKSWRSATAKERYELGEMIMYLFRDLSKGRVDPQVDAKNQGVERVLPAYYGRWDPDAEEHLPNCLGRAQLLSAFASLAKARCLSAIPMQDYWSFAWDIRSEIAAKVLSFCRGAGLSLSESGANSLKVLKDSIRIRDAESKMHHMALALQLRGNSWMLIDPNLYVRGELNEDWGMNRIYDLCSQTSKALPGFSYLQCNDELFRQRETLLRQTDLACARVLEFAQEINSRPHSKEEIVNALANSTFLDELLKLPEFAPHELPVSCSRRMKAICVLIEFLNQREESHRSSLSDEEALKTKSKHCLWFVFVRSWSEEQFLADIKDDEEANLAIQATILGYLTYGIKTQERLSDVSFGGRRIQHPALEFANTEWGLSAATISHVGVALNQSADTVEMLNRCVFRQRELVYLAARLLSGDRSANAKLSAQALKQLSFHSCGARMVLGGLNHSELTQTKELVCQ